jgi:ribosomal protein L35
MPKFHKSNRSLAKRIQVTSTGKVFKRLPGQNHFNAKNSGIVGMRKHGLKESPAGFTKGFQALLPATKIKY